MPFIDRTQEFFNIVESKKRHNSFETKKKETTTQKKAQNKKSQFYERASQASRSMQQTADTLEKLTALVKKRTPFDDNAESIQHLTVLVKEELHANSVILKELKQILAEQQEEQQASKHASTIVNALDSRLSYVAGRFQSVLKTRTQQIKQQRQRKREFSYESPNNLYSNRVLKTKSVQEQDGETRINFGGQQVLPPAQHTKIDGGEQEQDDSNTDSPVVQEQHHAELVLNMNDQYLKERTDEILNIEKSIIELGEMYKDLAHMVKQQGELAMSIERNVEDAVVNVEQAQDQLTQYLHKISGHRGLILKVFLVIVAFIIFISVFVLR